MLPGLLSNIQLVIVFQTSVSIFLFFSFLFFSIDKHTLTFLSPQVNELGLEDNVDPKLHPFTPTSARTRTNQVQSTLKKKVLFVDDVYSCNDRFLNSISSAVLVAWIDTNMNKRLTGAFELSSSCTVKDIDAKIEGNGTKLTFTYKWPERLLNGEQYNSAFVDILSGIKQRKYGRNHVKNIAWNSNTALLRGESSDKRVESKVTLDLPFKVEEQFTDEEGYNGYKFLKYSDGLKTLNLEMMGVRTNFLAAKGKQTDFEEVDDRQFEFKFPSKDSNKRPRGQPMDDEEDLFGL